MCFRHYQSSFETHQTPNVQFAGKQCKHSSFILSAPVKLSCTDAWTHLIPQVRRCSEALSTGDWGTARCLFDTLKVTFLWRCSLYKTVHGPDPKISTVGTSQVGNNVTEKLPISACNVCEYALLWGAKTCFLQERWNSRSSGKLIISFYLLWCNK